MCGIYGCIGKTTEQNTRECIKKIAYRGPDALEIKMLDGAAFGHARLSIIDLSDYANQPMTDISKRYTIVYNGEIYNYIEIRKELEQIGYKFRTNSDTEVVLYAYIEWGKNFQKKCNGMWALAIWDACERSLFLSRDRFGVKPLYYFQDKDNFYFASEMKALFPVMKHKKINYSVFERKDYFSYEATKDAIFRDVFKILPGHCAVYVRKVLKEECWWSTIENLVSVPTKYEEQVEMLQALFEDACAIRMRSDVPIGTALSGGIDSSAVVGCMNHIAKKSNSSICDNWQNVFVASIPGTSIDETDYAEIAAKHIGLEVNKVEINPNISIEQLYKYMYICENPYITSPIPFMQTYGAICDHGIKVTLDGHGADELFGGYGFDLFSAVTADSDESEIALVYETYSNMLGKHNDIVSVEEFKSYLAPNMSSPYGEKLDQFNTRLYQESHYNVLPTLLRCYDHYSMGNGLEIRMPFMDYRIVSFAFSIPWTSKIRDGFGKKIVRDMGRAYMPDKIMYRKDKIGFNSPMTEWLKNSNMKDFVYDIVSSRDFIECDLINPMLIKMQLYDFYKNDKERFVDGEQIWTLLVPYIWKKAMGV